MALMTNFIAVRALGANITGRSVVRLNFLLNVGRTKNVVSTLPTTHIIVNST